MPTIVSASDLGTFMDDLVNAYVLGIGTSGSGYGLGTGDGSYGASLAASDMRADLLSMTSTDFIAAIAKRTVNLYETLVGGKMMKARLSSVLASIENHVRQAEVAAGVVTINTYLEYLNVGAGGTWACLMPKQFRDLFYDWKNVYPNVSNVYFEVLQGSTYANALRKLVIGTGETAGATIDSTKYCGGFPYLKASAITGSGTVTVTGTQFDPATETATAGKTWTASVTGNGDFELTEGTAAADSLIVAVSAISAGGSLSAGTIYAEARRPSGRQLIG